MKIVDVEGNVEEFIKKNHLTRVFDKELLKSLKVQSFEINERIIEEDTQVKWLYLVISGKAAVAPSSLDGKTGLLDYILPMDIIGDLEYFASSNYVHSVLAMTPCQYLAIPTTLIPTYFDQNIDFYKFICWNMANKMQRTSRKYSRSMFSPIKNLLAEYLLDLSIHESSNELTVSSTLVAEHFSVSSRHVRRIMAEFATEGIITRHRSKIQIMNKGALRGYAPDHN